MFPQVHLDLPDKQLLLEKFKQIVNSGWLSEGKFTEEYVTEVSRLIGLKNVLPVPNGTLGLFLALSALKEQWGVGEVLIPAFTFYGSATPLLPLGFIPKFVDCSAETFQSELGHYMEQESGNTVGIMLVHVYGQVGEAQKIAEWARSKGYFIVEDAAQALGASSKGAMAGKFGDVAVFSTYSDKALPTGEGGLICSGDENLSKIIRYFRNQGRDNSGTFLHDMWGMNFRITEMQAAIGLHLLERYSIELARRRSLYKIYLKSATNSNVNTMDVQDVNEMVPFRFPVLVDDKNKTELKLNQAGFQTRSFFKPMHLQPIFRSTDQCLPNSEKISEAGLCLPVHSLVDANIIAKIIGCICE